MYERVHGFLTKICGILVKMFLYKVVSTDTLYALYMHYAGQGAARPHTIGAIFI
jgi:hypothetical protein